MGDTKIFVSIKIIYFLVYIISVNLFITLVDFYKNVQEHETINNQLQKKDHKNILVILIQLDLFH